MSDHAVFGGCLRSDIDLPELPATTCLQPDWTFRRANGPLPPSQHLGEDAVDDVIRVQCGRLPDGFRLHFDDTGTFDIAAGGRDITWTPGASAPLELVRADLLAGVFSAALHLQGLLCLHASAVALGGTAIGFLAAKGGGKSTLATALCAAGGSLVTDDMLPVHPGPPAMAWPSQPAVRLLHDSAHRLSLASGPTHPKTGKYHLNEMPRERVEGRRVPLAALYELAPVARDHARTPAQRTRVAGPMAVTTLLRHHRTGAVIGRAESARLFTRAGDVVRTVPVYRLEVARDFDRLDDVVALIRGWHAPEGPMNQETDAAVPRG